MNLDPIQWQEPPSTPCQSCNVQLWHIPLLDAEHSTPQDIHLAFPWLSADECQRSLRYLKPIDGARFALARASLRYILAKTLQYPPQDLHFTYSEHGKPSLTHHPELVFNLSHSHNHALLALKTTHKNQELKQQTLLGADTERQDPNRDLLSMSKRVFSTAEQHDTQHAKDLEERITRFYTIWTQKEAYIKALGLGMNLPLQQFQVSSDFKHPALINAWHEHAQPPHTWHMLSGTLAQNYPFAMCINQPVSAVECYKLTM